MPWIEHPKYISVRERLVVFLSSGHYRFRHVAPVVFLCGAAKSSARDALHKYLSRRHSELNLFYAEDVWNLIAARNDRSALRMESDLALLADMVLVVVESPGTFAELGAFSLSDPLRNKLLPIVDDKYHGSQSFISTGPLRWIDQDSKFKPTIYTVIPKILEAVDQVEERVARIPRSPTTHLEDLRQSPKHLLFFLCDLVAVIQPATFDMIEYYANRIIPATDPVEVDISTLVGLAVAMKLLKAQRIAGNIYLFAEPKALEKPFHHSRLANLPNLRAEHASVLLRIDESKSVLVASESLR